MSLVCVSEIRSSALSVGRVGDAREVGARADLLAALDRHRPAACPTCRRCTFRSSSCCLRRSHVALRWLTSASCGASCETHAFTRDLEAPLLGRQPVLQVLGEAALPLHGELGDEPVLVERFVRLEVQRGLLVLRLDIRGRRFLAEERALQLRLAVGVGRLRRLVAELGFLDRLGQLRIAQLENDAVGRDLRAGAEHDPSRPVPATARGSSGCLRGPACPSRAPGEASSRA